MTGNYQDGMGSNMGGVKQGRAQATQGLDIRHRTSDVETNRFLNIKTNNGQQASGPHEGGESRVRQAWRQDITPLPYMVQGCLH